MTSGTRYTREVLTVAAEQCEDIDAVILRFDDREPTPRLRQYLLRRFSAYRIEVPHFKTRPYTRHDMPDETLLRDAVTASTSLAETLRRLGRPVVHGWRESLKTWILETGLDTSHFLGQAHLRGKTRAAPSRAAAVLVQHEGKRRTPTKVLRRALREIGVPDRCDGCGTPPEWRGRPMTLEIDHINGDWRDDRRENLRLLCPNCHAITSTWCRGGVRRPREGMPS
ncbi:HNH endonuclease [Streptomyces sp. NPDC006430]|uniref:HNH endonuclease signature motif containing protein n=1 Tax=Streptomyces sp. NPDC006430 TaxID=3154299 RepID=UPI0033B2AEF2